MDASVLATDSVPAAKSANSKAPIGCDKAVVRVHLHRTKSSPRRKLVYTNAFACGALYTQQNMRAHPVPHNRLAIPNLFLEQLDRLRTHVEPHHPIWHVLIAAYLDTSRITRWVILPRLHTRPWSAITFSSLAGY
jgi:hypothetical protein